MGFPNVVCRLLIVRFVLLGLFVFVSIWADYRFVGSSRVAIRVFLEMWCGLMAHRARFDDFCFSNLGCRLLISRVLFSDYSRSSLLSVDSSSSLLSVGLSITDSSSSLGCFFLFFNLGVDYRCSVFSLRVIRVLQSRGVEY